MELHSLRDRPSLDPILGSDYVVDVAFVKQVVVMVGGRVMMQMTDSTFDVIGWAVPEVVE